MGCRGNALTTLCQELPKGQNIAFPKSNRRLRQTAPIGVLPVLSSGERYFIKYFIKPDLWKNRVLFFLPKLLDKNFVMCYTNYAKLIEYV